MIANGGKRSRFAIFVGLLATAFLVASLCIFFHFGALNALRGPSSGDDAWIALSAANLADGYGYATSVSSSRLIPFDPNISTGPVAVLGAAAMIGLFGHATWVPGVTQLLILLGQLLVITSIIARRHGLCRAAVSVAFLVTFILLASARDWYLGALLGEPLSVGFLVIGFLLLAERPSLFGVAGAGIAMSLAFLSKYIAIFPIAGAIFVSMAMDLSYSDRRRDFVRRYATFFSALGLLPLLFESLRLRNLGAHRFLATWKEVVARGTPSIHSGISVVDRIGTFWKTVSQDYSYLILILFIVTLLASFLSKSTIDLKMRNFALRYLAISFSAGAMLIIYFIFFSALWPRYLWIGVGVILSVPCITSLNINGRWRLFSILIGLLVFLVFRFGDSISSMEHLLQDQSVARERADVVSIVRRRPSNVPLVAESWASIDDVVYSLGRRRGLWAAGVDVQEFRGERALAIINSTFTNMNSDFAVRVIRNCTKLTPASRYIQLFECASL